MPSADRVAAVSIRLGHFTHVAPYDTEVGEVLLHPANLGTINYVHLTFLLHHLLQRCGVTGSAAFADDDFAHRVSNGLDELRPLLPFPHRAALTVVLLELDYAQGYAVDKDSVYAEGALISPASGNVEVGLDLVFLPNTEIMLSDSCELLFEVGPSIFADLQDEFVHGVRKEICQDKN